MASASEQPARQPARRVNQSDIQPRQMGFRFDPDIPRYWFADDQFKSILLTALSCTFPEGERFFVRSVRHFQPGITNPQLREEVKGFIGQEAHHGNEHEEFNAFLRSKGIRTEVVEEFTLRGLKFLGRWLSPERQLAKTCALEHFTAMLAELILEQPEFLEGMDERLLPLWVWHAVEESEHKSVAYDVYQDQVDSYWVRAREMAFTTIEFIGFNIYHYIQLRREMDDPTDWRSVWRGLNWLIGPRGRLHKIWPAYLAYYKRDFHPAKRDKRYLIDRGLQRLADMLGRPDLVEDRAA